MNATAAAYKRLKFSLREPLGTRPGGARLLARLGSWGHLLVRPDSRVCIEGYPRCANTFTVAAFQISQDDFESHIGRHSHLAGSVLLALEYGVPSLVLVREPRGATLSLKIHSPHLTLRQCLRAYIRFYRTLQPHRERFVIAGFDEVTDDFNSVLDRLAEKFRLDLAPLPAGPEAIERCFRQVEEMDRIVNRKETTTESQVARPSEERERTKERLSVDLEAASLQPLVAESLAVYEAFLPAPGRAASGA